MLWALVCSLIYDIELTKCIFTFSFYLFFSLPRNVYNIKSSLLLFVLGRIDMYTPLCRGITFFLLIDELIIHTCRVSILFLLYYAVKSFHLTYISHKVYINRVLPTFVSYSGNSLHDNVYTLCNNLLLMKSIFYNMYIYLFIDSLRHRILFQLASLIDNVKCFIIFYYFFIILFIY